VSNALPALKAAADVVTVAARGEGVAELIDGLLAGAHDVKARSNDDRRASLTGPKPA